MAEWPLVSTVVLPCSQRNSMIVQHINLTPYKNIIWQTSQNRALPKLRVMWSAMNDARVPGFNLWHKWICLLRKILTQQGWALLWLWDWHGRQRFLYTVALRPKMTCMVGWWASEPCQLLDQIFKHSSRASWDILAALCSHSYFPDQQLALVHVGTLSSYTHERESLIDEGGHLAG